MQNSDLIVLFLRNAVAKAMREGGSKFLEEMAEALDINQLDYMIGILKKVKGKKENVVSVNR